MVVGMMKVTFQTSVFNDASSSVIYLIVNKLLSLSLSHTHTHGEREYCEGDGRH